MTTPTKIDRWTMDDFALAFTATREADAKLAKIPEGAPESVARAVEDAIAALSILRGELLTTSARPRSVRR